MLEVPSTMGACGLQGVSPPGSPIVPGPLEAPALQVERSVSLFLGEFFLSK